MSSYVIRGSSARAQNVAYNVTVEQSGFATVTSESVKVDVGQAVALNIAMDVGKVAVEAGSGAHDLERRHALTPTCSATLPPPRRR